MDKRTAVQIEHDFPPFSSMVDALFKPGTFNEMVMHAAAGVAGETGELLLAVERRDQKNLIEEAGDAVFYLQKLITLKSWTMGMLHDSFEETDADKRRPPEINLMLAGCDLLDFAKKAWVYNEESPRVETGLLKSAARCYLYLEHILLEHGETLTHVQDENQIKLIGPNGRYRERVFSEAAAQARRDKEGDQQ